MNYPCLFLSFNGIHAPFFPKTAFALIDPTGDDKLIGRVTWTSVACDYDSPVDNQQYIRLNNNNLVISRSFLLPDNAPDFVLTHKMAGTDLTSTFLNTSGLPDGIPVKALAIAVQPKNETDPTFSYARQLLYYDYQSNTFAGSLDKGLRISKTPDSYLLYLGITPPTEGAYSKADITSPAGTYTRVVTLDKITTKYSITVTETDDVLHPFTYMTVKVPLLDKGSRVVNFCNDQIRNLPILPARPTVSNTSPLNLALNSTDSWTYDALVAGVTGAVVDSTLNDTFQETHVNIIRSWIANGLNGYFTEPGCSSGLSTITNLLGGDSWKYILDGSGLRPLYRLVTDDYRHNLGEAAYPVFTDGWMLINGSWEQRKSLKQLTLTYTELPTTKGPISSGTYGSLQDLVASTVYDSCGNGTDRFDFCITPITGNVTAALQLAPSGPVYNCTLHRWELHAQILLYPSTGSTSTACGVCPGEYTPTFLPQDVLWYNDVGTILTHPSGCYYLGTYTFSGAEYRSSFSASDGIDSPPDVNTVPTCDAVATYNAALTKYVFAKSGEAAFNAMINVLGPITIGFSGSGTTGPVPSAVSGPFFLTASGATGAYTTHSLFESGQPIPLYSTLARDQFTNTGAGYLIGGNKWYTAMQTGAVQVTPWLPFVASQLVPPVTVLELTKSTIYTNQHTQQLDGCITGTVVSEDCCINQAPSSSKTAFYPYGVFKDDEPNVTYWLEGHTDSVTKASSDAIYENLKMRFAGPISWNGFLVMREFDFSSNALLPTAKVGRRITDPDIYSFGEQLLKLQSLQQLDRSLGPFIKTDTNGQFTVNGATLSTEYVSDSATTYQYVTIPSVYDTYNYAMKEHILASLLTASTAKTVVSSVAGTGICSTTLTTTYHCTVNYVSKVEILSTRFRGNHAEAFCKLTMALYSYNTKDPNEAVVRLDSICKDEAAEIAASFNTSIIAKHQLYKRGANGSAYTGQCYSTTVPCAQDLPVSTGACYIEPYQDVILAKLKPQHCLDENYASVAITPSSGYNLVRRLITCMDPEVNCLNTANREWLSLGYVTSQNQTIPHVTKYVGACNDCIYGTRTALISEVKPIWLTVGSLTTCVPPPYNQSVNTQFGFTCSSVVMPNKALDYLIIMVGKINCGDAGSAGCSSTGLAPLPTHCIWQWNADCCSYERVCTDSNSGSVSCGCASCNRTCVAQDTVLSCSNSLCVNQGTGYFKSADASPEMIHIMMECYRTYTGNTTIPDPVVLEFPANCAGVPSLYCASPVTQWPAEVIPVYLP